MIFSRFGLWAHKTLSDGSQSTWQKATRQRKCCHRNTSRSFCHSYVTTGRLNFLCVCRVVTNKKNITNAASDLIDAAKIMFLWIEKTSRNSVCNCLLQQHKNCENCIKIWFGLHKDQYQNPSHDDCNWLTLILACQLTDCPLMINPAFYALLWVYHLWCPGLPWWCNE